MPEPRTPKKPTAASRTDILLEELSSKFGAFHDGLAFVRDHVARMLPVVEETAEEMRLVKAILRTNTKDIAELKSNMVEVKTDVATLKSDMVEVKADLKEIKTDVKSHNRRLTALESPAA